MQDKTYKLVELVGVSEDSVQQAVRNAIKRASASLKGVSWFEVTDIRGLGAGPKRVAVRGLARTGIERKETVSVEVPKLARARRTPADDEFHHHCDEIALTTAGCALWAIAFILTGILAGAAWASVSSTIGKAGLGVVAVAGALYAARTASRR